MSSDQIQFSLSSALLAALSPILAQHHLPAATDAGVSRPPRRELGDFASNLAMRYAKKLALPPMELAQHLADNLQQHPQVHRCEVAKPGFLNIYLAENLHTQILANILQQGDSYGRGKATGEKILVEYVSSNPTGPLHIGHGRGAAYGATLVNLLRFSGHTVDSEYYVNDAGRQMAILTLSVWLRAMQAQHQLAFPERCYQGDYVISLARQSAVAAWQGNEQIESVTHNLPDDPELAVDSCLQRVEEGIGKAAFAEMQQTIGTAMVALIRDQLAAFHVNMDNWFSEQSLIHSGKVTAVMSQLRDAGLVYQKEGAHWFRSTQFGDEKDRVVIRSNGNYTYFATDIAYHLDKCERGYGRLINVFGADHHGYIVRLRAALSALGQQQVQLDFVVNQLAVLCRGKEKLALSTRAGVLVALDELFDMIGVEEARFMYVTQRHDQHLELDMELAASQSRDNPVYYVNYAYARAGQICLQAEKSGIAYSLEEALTCLDQLRDEREFALIDKLAQFPELIQLAAARCNPHALTIYVRELAGMFHNYYAGVKVIDPNGPVQPRLALCVALRQVIRSTLGLLNIQPPEQM